MRVLPDFNLANNDNFGNRLRNIGVSFASFNYIGISNPSAAAPNYSGVINLGLDLSVVPGFRAPQFEDFSLMPNSMLVNAGITSRPTPFQDFAGKFARRAAGHRGVRVRGDAGP